MMRLAAMLQVLFWQTKYEQRVNTFVYNYFIKYKEGESKYEQK